MSKRDDLLKSMSRPLGPEIDIDSADSSVRQEVKTSDTALVVDRYTRSMGRELVYSLGESASGSFGHNDELVDAVASDMINAAFEPCPKMAENCVSQERSEFMESLLESPEYQKLHRGTKLNRIASELAAVHFGRQYVAYEAEQSEESEDDQDGQSGDGDRDGQPGGDPDGHTEKAIKEAQDDVDTVNETMAAMGVKGDSCNTGINYDNMKQLFSNMQNSRILKLVMQKAGRWRAMAQSCQGTKYVDGMDEVVGIEFGKDIKRLLPSELVYLADPELEDLFWQKYANQGLRMRVTADLAQEMQGPVVVAVDESGSMDWGKAHIYDAKAMALAMLWIARSQKRPCILVGFSGEDATGNWYVERPGERPDVNQLMKWVEHFYNGGTHSRILIDEIPRQIMLDKSFGHKTDILCITDGVIEKPAESKLQAFRNFKASHGVKFKTISLGEDIGTLADESDEHFLIEELDIHDDSTKSAFSI